MVIAFLFGGLCGAVTMAIVAADSYRKGYEDGMLRRKLKEKMNIKEEFINELWRFKRPKQAPAL
jgi:hypothetical protein